MAKGSDDIQALVALMARLPGLGPRSARRIVLALIRKRSGQMVQLAQLLDRVAVNSRECLTCGNITDRDECAICADPRRANGEICVVEDVADLWALERTGVFRGRYHVLGGALSALDGVGPEDLNIPRLVARASESQVREVIVATSSTVDGQTTAHYLADRLADCGVEISRLAQGVPVGGELEYLDDGTLAAALKARGPL